MAEQKVKLTQLPAANDTSDTAQLLVNQNQTDQRLPVTHFLRAKNNLSDIQDNVQARANLGATSPDEVDNKIKNLFDGKATFLNGGSLASRKDLIWDDSSKSWYFWSGNLPKQVPAASSPQETGGVSSGAWVSVGNSTLSSTEDGLGDALIGVKLPYAGAVARTQHEKNLDIISVKDFGAKGDGVTDDTSAIQALIDYASANNGFIFFPAGVYMVSQLVIKDKTRMFGLGRASIIKRISLNGLDLLYGLNSNSLWGTKDANVTDFARDVEIHSLHLDGGVDGLKVPFSTSQAGSAIAIWGHDFRFYNLDIRNFADKGIRTECIDTNIDWAHTWQESSFYSIRIRNVGGHGWQFDGPHDSKFTDISIINASQKEDNTYDGMITGSQGTGDFSGLHISVSGNNTGNQESLRHRYSLNLNTSCRFSGGTSIEGARVPLRMACSGSQFDSSCTYYAAWGAGRDAIAIKMEGSCSLNILRGVVNGSEGFRPSFNQFGVVFGVGNDDIVNNNTIDLTINGCNIPISFGASTLAADGDKGNNSIKIKGYYNGSKTPVGSYGVLNSAKGSSIEMELTGVSPQIVNSLLQNRVFSVASGGAVEWTFKYPFASTPVVSTAIVGPPVTPTNGVWISAISNTSLTLFNGTGTSITLHASATRQVAA